jgi:lipopolysaccharide/colanic/teichoic acid biosynthesis glycosyltransferase/glycosyltransferase involved in cell wall biosynthesis
LKVVLIHQAFLTGNEGGGTRHYEFARLLAERGHHLTVVASPVSYLTGQEIDREARAAVQEEIGIQIKHPWVLRGLHKSYRYRLLNFLSFMCSSFAAALREARSADVVWGTTPPIFQAVSAWAVARAGRVPFMLEVRDLWPDFAIELGVLQNRVLIAFSRQLERFLYTHSDRIVINSPGFNTHLYANGVAREKIALVPNGTDVAFFSQAIDREDVRRRLGIHDEFVVLYAGAMGIANDLETLLFAANSLDREDILFLLVGDGKDRHRLEMLAARLRCRSVRFERAQPKAAMPAILAAADLCVASLRSIPMFATTYPNKVFDYMAAGKPTVLAIDGPIREVIETSSSGMFVSPGDPEAMANAISAYEQDRQLVAAQGSNARDFVSSHFDRHKQVDDLETVLADLYEQLHARKRPLRARVPSEARLARRVKRVIDIGIAGGALVALSPVALFVAALIRARMGTPIIFRQQRLGFQGRPFELLKFRSMSDMRAEDGVLLPDGDRLTALGRFLRRTSLDEIPEFINVLRGEMSIVGPRPLLPEYRDLYTDEQWRRHHVRPGIAGPVLAGGRNSLSWERKFELDTWYVDNWSLKLDFAILMGTVRTIITSKGVNAQGHATMPRFRGTPPIVNS